MAAHPDHLLGFCYINPRHGSDAMAEIDRCVVRGGMAGIKLWVACKASDPLVDPVLERAAELGVPVLQHAWNKAVGQLEHESTSADVAEMGRRHPRATILIAHLMGIGYRGVLEIAPYPNILVDTSGGDPEAGVVEYAVRQLGAERVFFRRAGALLRRATGQGPRRPTHTGAARPDPVRQRGKDTRTMIDINAFAGPWPFRALPATLPADVATMLQEAGIARALVSSLEALFFEDPQIANERLAARRNPMASCSPARDQPLAGQLALLRIAQERSARGRTHRYHCYDLNPARRCWPPRGGSLCHPARCGIFARNILLQGPDVSVDSRDAAEAAQARGSSRIRWRKCSRRPPASALSNVWIELSQVENVDGVRKRHAVGANRIVLGTGAPS